MRMYDIIAKKRDGSELSNDEIAFFIKGCLDGTIPDYQLSALLMAIFLKGMTKAETVALTLMMAHSGDMVNLSGIDGVKVDKHSTGGVGDKTTLIVGPMAAACGLKVAKMSGRGLGYTGGTADKLESIPRFNTRIERREFIDNVIRHGISLIYQSGNLAPADKILYALRDVTATVESIPLISSSIMSKKLASGADKILLDVKTGSGAFMKSLSDSIELARCMVDIGDGAGHETAALITNMDRPLGKAIGNTLEVIEAIEVLKGRGPGDLIEICVALCANMLYLAHIGDFNDCLKKAQQSILNGSALNKFRELVIAQGGDDRVIDDYSRFKKPLFERNILSDTDGYICCVKTDEIGRASMLLGAGREKVDSAIDFSAGIMLNKKTGDRVKREEILATMYSDNEKKFSDAKDVFLNSFTFGEIQPKESKLIYARIDKKGTELF